MSKAVAGGLAVLLLAAGVLTLATAAVLMNRNQPPAGPAQDYVTQTITYEVPPEGKNPEQLTRYTLMERSGTPFASEDLEGKVHVVSFFFARCPAECWKLNQQVAELARRYGPKGVKFVSITVDPENDSPARLAEYADKVNADAEDWVFLTGDLDYISRIGQEIYKLPVARKSHTKRLMVMDKWGRNRGAYRFDDGDQIAEMRLQLVKLLAESSPPEVESPQEKMLREALEEEEKSLDEPIPVLPATVTPAKATPADAATAEDG